MEQQITQPTPQAPLQTTPPNFYHRHYRSLWATLITVAVAVTALLIYALFFRNVEPPAQYVGDVQLAIVAPEESVSGSEMSYEITFENLSSAKLKELSLEMFYPQGFIFVDSSAEAKIITDEADGGRRFSFTDLERRKQYKLVVFGRLEGNVQEIKSVSAKLHYVPENFNSSFLATADASTVMLPPEISMRINGPAQLISGEKITYEIEITNVSAEDFSNLRLEVVYPESFSFIAANPAAQTQQTDGLAHWIIASLAAAEGRTITLEGRLTSPPGTDVYLAAELFTTRDDDKLSAGRSYAFTRMLEAPLRLTQNLVGGEGTVLAGEKLEYEINYENIGGVALSNVSITAFFESQVFDLSRAQSQKGQIRGNEMVWLPAVASALRSVDPGERGQFTIQVPIKAENLLTQKNPQAVTRVEFDADELSESISGNRISLKIGTNLSVTSSLTHLSGPVTPQVGQTSIYAVSLSVKNSVNDVENARLTALLPRTDVVFSAQTVKPQDEAANVQYGSSSGTLTWNLGKVFAFSGSIHQSRTITFEVSITPEQEDFDYLLLSEIEAVGLDSFTNEMIFSNKIREIEIK